MILFCISNSVRRPTGSLFVLFPSVLLTTKLQFYVLNWLLSGLLSEHKWPEIFFSLCENSDIRLRYKDYLFNQTFNLNAHNRNIRIHFKQSMSSENPSIFSNLENSKFSPNSDHHHALENVWKLSVFCCGVEISGI